MICLFNAVIFQLLSVVCVYVHVHKGYQCHYVKSIIKLLLNSRIDVDFWLKNLTV